MRRWVPVAAGIAAYDVALILRGGPSLSAEFAAAVRHPVHRWWLLAGWALLTAHLVDCIPDRFDPFGHVSRVLSANGDGCVWD